MALYAFRFDTLHTIAPRSKRSDDDILTFLVRVNQRERGRGAGRFSAQARGSVGRTDPTGVNGVAPNLRRGMGADWIIGPLEIADDDQVEIVITVVNVSDASLSDQDAEELELKILDALVVGAATSAAGLFTGLGTFVGEGVTSAIGWVTDPIGKLIGHERTGPCNGGVLAEALTFTGANLARLDYADPSPNPFNDLPTSTECPISRRQQAATQPENCGDRADTEVTVSVLAVAPPISIAHYAGRRVPADERDSRLSPLGDPGAGEPVSVKQLLGFTT